MPTMADIQRVNFRWWTHSESIHFKREKPDLDFRRNRMILQDKVALVTGETSGIDRATTLAKLNEVIAYAQQQAKVVVVGRRIDEGEETFLF
jgi:hypothetical protein